MTWLWRPPPQPQQRGPGIAALIAPPPVTPDNPPLRGAFVLTAFTALLAWMPAPNGAQAATKNLAWLTPPPVIDNPPLCQPSAARSLGAWQLAAPRAQGSPTSLAWLAVAPSVDNPPLAAPTAPESLLAWAAAPVAKQPRPSCAAWVPSVVSVSSAAPRYLGSLTITGLNLGGSTGTASIGGASCNVTAWSSTSITIDVARGINKYGTPLTVQIVTADGRTSNAYAGVTGLLPQTGWNYVDLATPDATATHRITAVADLASGDQLAWNTVGGDVNVNADATFDVGPLILSFDVEGWTPSVWGATATQFVSDDPVYGQVRQGARIARLWWPDVAPPQPPRLLPVAPLLPPPPVPDNPPLVVPAAPEALTAWLPGFVLPARPSSFAPLAPAPIVPDNPPAVRLAAPGALWLWVPPAPLPARPAAIAPLVPAAPDSPPLTRPSAFVQAYLWAPVPPLPARARTSLAWAFIPPVIDNPPLRRPALPFTPVPWQPLPAQRPGMAQLIPVPVLVPADLQLPWTLVMDTTRPVPATILDTSASLLYHVDKDSLVLL